MMYCRLLFLFLFGWVSLQAEEPVALYLTWQNDPHTTMTVCWITKGKGKEEGVEYQRTGETTWKPREGVSLPLPDKFGFYAHNAELKELTPNTEYLVRLGKDGKPYKFKTLSEESGQSLNFIVGGDVYHDDLSYVTKMNRQAAKLNPAFIILGGDLSYNEVKKGAFPKQQNRWIDLAATWKTDLISPEGRLIPILTLIGNHDVSGRWGITKANAPHYYALFPSSGYSAFHVGNFATLLLLDSGHTHKIEGEQVAWLERNLGNRSQIPHKIAFYHVAAWPSIRHFDGGKKEEIRKHWIPLFEKYGVQFAFEHHDHAYKRTHPLLEGKIDPRGITYIGDGCWGVEEPRSPKKGYRWYIAKGMPKRNLILVHLHGNSRHLIVYDDEGEILDEIYSR